MLYYNHKLTAHTVFQTKITQRFSYMSPQPRAPIFSLLVRELIERIFPICTELGSIYPHPWLLKIYNFAMPYFVSKIFFVSCRNQ